MQVHAGQAISFTRLDTSSVSRWWWTVDKLILAAVTALVCIGVLLTLAASPAAAHRIRVPSFHFVYRHVAFVPVTLGLLWVVSLQTHRVVRYLGIIGFALSLSLTCLTLAIGEEIKGATRWINILGLSLQPSEFVKPTFAIVTAWILTASRIRKRVAFGDWITILLCSMVVVTLLLQPDVGMSMIVSIVWAIQYFLAGLGLFWVFLLIIGGISSSIGAYFLFDHVRSRINRFIDPGSGDSYQIIKALQAFRHGGLIGTGPGEGRIKEVLPDAHTDFIFAVAGEEFGLILCLLIVLLFAFVVLRGFILAFQSNNLFVLLATSGLLVQFGLQAIINMASSLRLVPTKGMTLPFISYGGSSMLALALSMGMVLALTKRCSGENDLL